MTLSIIFSIWPQSQSQESHVSERNDDLRAGLKWLDCSSPIPHRCGPWSQRAVHFSHTCLVFLCLLVLILLPPPFLSGHLHVVVFFYIVGYIVSSDERLVVHVALSRAEHAAERMRSSARTAQAAQCKSAIASVWSENPKWRLFGVTYAPPWAVYSV